MAAGQGGGGLWLWTAVETRRVQKKVHSCALAFGAMGIVTLSPWGPLGAGRTSPSFRLVRTRPFPSSNSADTQRGALGPKETMMIKETTMAFHFHTKLPRSVGSVWGENPTGEEYNAPLVAF